MATHGDLQWGVKESFRQYIDRAEGTVTLTDGAELADDGRIVFPQTGAESLDGLPKVIRFGGGAEFSAHEGLLLVRLRVPWLEFDESGVTLSFMHPAFRDVTERRLTLCRLDVTSPSIEAGSLTIEAAPASLLIEATGTFDNLYGPGVEFDPVTVRAHVDCISPETRD